VVFSFSIVRSRERESERERVKVKNQLGEKKKKERGMEGIYRSFGSPPPSPSAGRERGFLPAFFGGGRSSAKAESQVKDKGGERRKRERET
jgi:hypothetical protein